MARGDSRADEVPSGSLVDIGGELDEERSSPGEARRHSDECPGIGLDQAPRKETREMMPAVRKAAVVADPGHGRRSTVPSGWSEMRPTQGDRIRSTSGTSPMVRIRAKARIAEAGYAFWRTLAAARSVVPFVRTSSTRTISLGESSRGRPAAPRESTWSLSDGRFPGEDQADFRTGDVRRRRGRTAPPMPTVTSRSAIRRGTQRDFASFCGALRGTGTSAAPSGKCAASGDPGRCQEF